MDISKVFLDNSIQLFTAMKKQVENSITQVPDDLLIWLPNNESNSIAIIMKHIAGNMHSRWTDIFTTDGEKEWRNRPSEFDINFKPNRDELMRLWDDAWKILFTTLQSLTQDDMSRDIYIRKEAHSVLEAIQRQLTHYSTHVGQITFLCKLIAKDDWKTLSIPRNKIIMDAKDIDNVRQEYNKFK